MTHPAAQIVDAIQALCATALEPKGVHVYKHRRESVSPEQDELPTLSIDFGEDAAFDSQFMSSIDSGLTVVLTCVAVAPTEAEVRERLLSLRESTDDLMFAEMLKPNGQKLGLNFVRGVSWLSATAPEFDNEGEKPVGGLALSWQVKYRMR